MTIEYEFVEEIAASPDKVFEALVDLDAITEYVPAEVEIERLTDGPVSEGSKWREHRRMMKREASEVFEVTDFAPPKRLRLFVDGRKGTTGRGEFVYTYRLEPTEGGTQLHLDCEIDDIGCIGEQLSKLFAGSFKKAIRKDLRGLKDYVESASASGSAGE